MSITDRLSIGILVAALACAAPRTARACSRPPPQPTLIGVPADGDTDVPTDVVPYYQLPIGAPVPVAPMTPGTGPAGMLPGDFALTAADGTSVAVTTGAGDVWNFAIVPAQPLAPHTQYVLRAQWTLMATMQVSTNEIRFTTGDGPLATPPAPPVARLVHYHLNAPLTSCSREEYGTCISVGDDSGFIEVTYIDSFNQEQGTYGALGSSFGNNLSGFQQGTNFTCVKLRTRALNGTLSDPVMLCGADFALQEIQDTDQIACSSVGVTSVAPPAQDAGQVVADPGASSDAGTALLNQPQPDPPASGSRNPAAPIPVAINDMPTSSPVAATDTHDPAATPAPQSSSCSAAPIAASSADVSVLAAALVLVASRRRRLGRR